MGGLLNPDIGLMVWTIVTFILVAGVLGRFAWKPLLAALDEREARLRAEAAQAEEARRAAESLKGDYDRRLAEMEARTHDLISKARADADRQRDELLKAAQEESARLHEKTRAELKEEQARVVREIRKDVAEMSVRITEKLLGKAVDAAAREDFSKQAMAEIERAGPN